MHRATFTVAVVLLAAGVAGAFVGYTHARLESDEAKRVGKVIVWTSQRDYDECQNALAADDDNRVAICKRAKAAILPEGTNMLVLEPPGWFSGWMHVQVIEGQFKGARGWIDLLDCDAVRESK